MRMGVPLAVVAAVLLLVSGAAAQPKLTVNITSFHNNDPVAVTLSGVSSPSVNDSVALFLASAFDPDVLRPIKCATCLSVAPACVHLTSHRSMPDREVTS